MKHRFEIPTPPAARVVSVGTLRSIDHDINLDAFSDNTLAEMQHVASRITDDGAEVLVSIVIESQTHHEAGQASVPLDRFQNQIRMRLFLNPPHDMAALDEFEGIDLKRQSASRTFEHEKQLSMIGSFLATSWGRHSLRKFSLCAATMAWIGLVERFNTDSLDESVNEIRDVLTIGTTRRGERRRISDFCTITSENLCCSPHA